MELPENSVRIRIFIGESDRFEHQPLYEAIVEKAKKMNMAGSTVIHGVMGFGKSSRIHTSKILRLSEDLPVIIEIVDHPERINEFLPILETMMHGGLVTMENVTVIRYQEHK